MRFLIILLLLHCCWLTARADHITGGEMFYTYVGKNGDLYTYHFTGKLFMRCNSGREFNNPTTITVFDKVTNARIKDIIVNLSSQQTLNLTNTNKCITNPPPVCYEVGYYDFEISLPGSPNGYLVACQVNFRIAGISNLESGYRNIGATYTAEIPATAPLATAPQNNSARFVGNDLVVVCAGNSFSYSFAAEDADGDVLNYTFCNAYVSNNGAGNTGAPPGSPPYASVPYSSAFGSGNPLGNAVTINATTGLITGIAPAVGVYVVTVCVNEIRGGVVIATQRKDLQINIASCTIASASLQPVYTLCKNTTSLSIENISTSPLINTYDWELFNNRGVSVFTSQEKIFHYNFPDTGVYNIKLVINKKADCSDSTTATIRVYPGFVPNFNVEGVCFKKPSTFFDATTSVYGNVNSWQWVLGNASQPNATSQNATATLNTPGPNNVQLIVGNSVGCRDTIAKTINIVDKPALTLLFKDTTICIKDKLQLNASGGGTFSWTPATNIINANTASPEVQPTASTTYVVTLNDNGCLNKDSVKVNVVTAVHVQAMADTTICAGDSVQLKVTSDAFTFLWSPAALLNNATLKNPIATTTGQMTYGVTGRIGGCVAQDEVVVSVAPYPLVNTGADTTICYNSTAALHATSTGTSITWQPSTLNNNKIFNPIAHPLKTTTYIATVTANDGCPKPISDSVIVSVLPQIKASAGRDTSVIAGQPLQLNATGGVQYIWSPANYLSAYNIANPLAVYNKEITKIQYKVLVFNEAGCVDSAYLTINIFTTEPTVFVPSAFTPNGDGKNDFLKPIAVGISRIDLFQVYNRWGQKVYEGGSNENGWDGKINGKEQRTETFVWIVSAIDFTGKRLTKKGLVTLIH